MSCSKNINVEFKVMRCDVVRIWMRIHNLTAKQRRCDLSVWADTAFVLINGISYLHWFVVTAFSFSLCCADGRCVGGCWDVCRCCSFILHLPAVERWTLQLPPLSPCRWPGSRTTNSRSVSGVSLSFGANVNLERNLLKDYLLPTHKTTLDWMMNLRINSNVSIYHFRRELWRYSSTTEKCGL